MGHQWGADFFVLSDGKDLTIRRGDDEMTCKNVFLKSFDMRQQEIDVSHPGGWYQREQGPTEITLTFECAGAFVLGCPAELADRTIAELLELVQKKVKERDGS